MEMGFEQSECVETQVPVTVSAPDRGRRENARGEHKGRFP